MEQKTNLILMIHFRMSGKKMECSYKTFMIKKAHE